MKENNLPLYSLTVQQFKEIFFEVIKTSVQEVIAENANGPPDDILSVDEACALLKISRPSLYLLFKTKQLKKRKLNGRTIVRRDEINNLLK